MPLPVKHKLLKAKVAQATAVRVFQFRQRLWIAFYVSVWPLIPGAIVVKFAQRLKTRKVLQPMCLGGAKSLIGLKVLSSRTLICCKENFSSHRDQGLRGLSLRLQACDKAFCD